MDKYFNNVSYHNNDVVIVDYTESTKKCTVKRGVEIIDPGTDLEIKGLTVLNKNCINFAFVNFEKNVLKNSQGDRISQCECLCVANEKDPVKKWVFLAELKYCEYQNAKSSILEAYKQLRSTYEYLKDKKIINNYKIYLIVSLPNQSNVPFENFVFSQHNLSELRRKESLIVRGVNSISIRNASGLKV